jgi:hypothetical protein
MTTDERLARLEREVRWTRIVGGVAVVALVVLSVGLSKQVFGPSDARFNVVRAEKIMLVDRTEKPRIELATSHAWTGLRIHDQAGDGKVILGVGGRMPTFQAHRDDKGEVRLGFDGDGKATLHLQSAPSTSYTMSVNDEEGAFYYLGKGKMAYIWPKP